jgi:hypothetical protein
MNRRRVIFGVFVLLASFLLLWFWPQPETASQSSDQKLPPPKPSSAQANLDAPSVKPAPAALNLEQTEQAQEEKKKNIIAKIVAMMSAPITFYGKVVDQNGDPVPDAHIGFSLADKFAASGSNDYMKASRDGSFSIIGVKGAVLGVNVNKEGYYQIQDVSNQRFAYGVASDGYTKPPPAKENPAVFVLQKMGQAMALIKIEKYVRTERNGSPKQINLQTGRLTSLGNFKVEAWTNDQAKDAQGHYDWKCRISVPGGGLIERKNDFAFEAPADGYRPSDEIVMPQNAERWNPQASRQYFVKLSNNHFARIEFEMVAGGDHFFSITSYLNPTPGSRNLEFDPAKAIEP